MNANETLKTLGYGTTTEEIARFQRDYLELAPASLMVTGKLDGPTLNALELAHSSRVLFESVRDKTEW